MGDEVQDAGSPSASDMQDDSLRIDTSAPAAVDPGADSSDSSSEKKDEPFDLLSVIRKVGEKKDDAAASSAEPEEHGDRTQPGPSASTPEAKEPDDENFSDVPFHKHPRFQQLVQQRNAYKQGHDEYAKLTDFLAETGVAPKEAAQILEIRALMKSDPAEAWKHLKPMVQQLLADAGELLPADLQQRVKKGEMTRDAAMELSRLRAAQTNMQRVSQHEQTVSQQRAQRESVQARVNAVVAWEREQSKDPTFVAMQEDIQKELLWIHKRDGVAADPDSAVKQAQAAWDAVRKRAKAAAPVRKPVTPVTGGRGAGGNTAPQAKSVLDIVRSRGATG